MSTYGVAMCCSLAPILANLFLVHFEGIWLNELSCIKPSFYSRYVDDIIAVFNNQNGAEQFLNNLNSKHKNIKFTMETEKGEKLPFLDVYSDNSGSKLITRYRENTFSGHINKLF